MYSRTEASQVRQAFWTAFGQYLAPQYSAEGERVNWINYKTGERHVLFKMHADTRLASIAIELTHPDHDIQQLFFEQFEQFKPLLHQHVGETWTWQLHTHNEAGRTISRIFTECAGVNLMKREDWPQLISFFKPRLIALDAFWSDVKYAFEALR
jgi:hypothetical protein